MQSSYKNMHSLDGNTVALELKYNLYPVKKNLKFPDGSHYTYLKQMTGLV